MKNVAHISCIQILSRLAVYALLTIILPVATNVTYAAEPSIDISFGTQKQHLTRTELLRLPALRTIKVRSDIVYKRTTSYQAIPLSALITSMPLIESVQFTALDGFVANIPGSLLTSEAQPWLAIEQANKGWPPLKSGSSSAGPFYLVWLAPEKAGISPEQWPYQIAKISEAAPLEKRYPQILPKTEANSPEQRGMHVFIANCATCHKMNGGGDAAVGPDLNIPLSPTEYFKEPFLRKLIRDPTSVRNWNRLAMPGFTPSVLSDTQLDELLSYLQQMAIQR
ncbi:c-type cytochrome [Sulfurirhabdus autotrophica]|uniref:Mono/diheme cytochrome c family protein n=1 Tax=Sulfurirhabdus autotrophica TaxID=1706046 RepID=A0A4R3YBZ7_9PROT|nr:cytochrome c [Sulfurirhabdus autotrophica]TCV89516.1 mono/diheme cytochrome c family protein [Sulfurirhabdus autotrophica]